MKIKPKKFWGWGEEGRLYDDHLRPKLWPFLENMGGVRMNFPIANKEEIALPAPIRNEAFISELASVFKQSQICDDHHNRLTHTYNQSYMDLFRLRKGIVERAADVVIFPESHADVEKLVATAHQHNVVVIPYGGGTNVARGTEPESDEKRMVAVVNMERMNKIIKIDHQSRIAHVEAGIIGKQLEYELNETGYTCGHDPDSIEYSTLGGWIASRSSGMLSNKYGDMVDLLVSVKMVTPRGTLQTALVPATSGGPDMNRFIAGSEGNFGIITQAVIHVFKLPEVKIYRALLFPSFAKGLEAIQQFVEVDTIPSLIRLLNPEETMLSASTSKKSTKMKSFISKMMMKYLTRVNHFDQVNMCLMFLGFHGNKKETYDAYKKAMKIAKHYGGFDIGESPARTWDESKYDLAMLRDMVIKNGIMTDALETSTVWSNVLNLYTKSKQAIEEAMAKYSKTTWAACHLSHTYRHGACLYFIFATTEHEGKEIEQFLCVKNAATESFVKNGGCVSHHHSVGKLHKPFLENEIGEMNLRILRETKKYLDPNNILNPGKLL